MVSSAATPSAPESSDLGLRVRHAKSYANIFLTGLCSGLAALLLVIILGYVTIQGIHGMSWAFLTQLPKPVGEEGGGVVNGIVGSVIVVALSTIIAAPIGVLTGIFLALYARGIVAETVRFLSVVLSGIPSIALGLFAYVMFVAPFKQFSAMSAAIAFAIMMLPLIIRTSEEAIRSVPRAIREGALALGMSSFQATMQIVVPTARPAIVTGLLLGIARVSGETAPLLFTAFGSPYWEVNPLRPMAVLAKQVFDYAISPYESWHEQAWAGALLLIAAVLGLNILARLVLTRGPKVG